MFYAEVLAMAQQEGEPFLVWILDHMYFDEAIEIMQDTAAYGEDDMVEELISTGKVAFYVKDEDSYYCGNDRYLSHPPMSALVQYVKLLAEDGVGYTFFIENRNN